MNILFTRFSTGGKKKPKYETHHFSPERMLTVALFKRRRK